MNRRNKVGTALVGVAVLLFVIPAAFPVQPVLTHDTRDSVPFGPERLEEDGFEIISYENLSDRGQKLYVRTLERGGEYRVTRGDGAPDFAYPTDAERIEAFQNDSHERLGRVVVERPADDSGLPEADERVYGEGRDDENRTEYRERVLRYDAMRTGIEAPLLGSPPQLARLVAALLAVLSLGIGGYLLSSK